MHDWSCQWSIRGQKELPGCCVLDDFFNYLFVELGPCRAAKPPHRLGRWFGAGSLVHVPDVPLGIGSRPLYTKRAQDFTGSGDGLVWPELCLRILVTLKPWAAQKHLLCWWFFKYYLVSSTWSISISFHDQFTGNPHWKATTSIEVKCLTRIHQHNFLIRGICGFGAFLSGIKLHAALQGFLPLLHADMGSNRIEDIASTFTGYQAE